MPTERLQLRESLYASGGGIAVFTHQNPSTRNALSAALRDDYIEMIERVSEDSEVRVLVITGSDGSFCSGGNLKALAPASQSLPDGPCDAMRRRIRAGHRWMEQLRSLEIPVIAAVDGPAYGAGFSLALAADFIFASTRATFCMSFAKVGLVPDLGAAFHLPRVVGLQLAKELAYTGRRVSAQEAQRIGLVHTVCAPDSLLDEAGHFAQRFLDAPRTATALTKALLNKSFETPYSTLAELEANSQAVCSTTAFHTEAVGAFLRGEGALFDWDRSRPERDK